MIRFGRAGRVVFTAFAAGMVSAASAQGFFPAKPDQFAPALVAREDAPLARITPVSDAMLRDPPAGDWLMWRRTYDGRGWSPLKQVDRTNVAHLQLAWSWALANGATEIAPVVHDGVLFIQNHDEGVEALNAASGDLLWRYARPRAKGVTIFPKRSMALTGDTVVVATSDRHLVALGARDGKVRWDAAVPGEGAAFTSGPMALDGRIVIGATNCVTARCFISAHSAADGHELWRFNTVAASGEPGGDSWNGLPLDQRFGGSAWTSGSFDPGTGLLYWGTGQPYPWNSFARGTNRTVDGPGNALLYTDSTLALDPATGKLAWHYAHLPNDNWDMDYVFERTLVDGTVAGKPQRLVVTTGKLGIVEALDARTGRFAWAHDSGLQNIVARIDPVTGEKAINPAAIPAIGKPVTICPHPGGARSGASTAYDPELHLLFLPMQEHCTEMVARAREAGQRTAQVDFTLQLRPGSDGNVGRLEAMDLRTGRLAWQHRERAPQSTAALPTAGGVVFVGNLDRYFSAYDARDGRLLWRTRLNDVPNGPPITFTAGGRQFVAVTTGSGSPFTRTWGNLVPDIRGPAQGGATLWVFALPDRR